MTWHLQFRLEDGPPEVLLERVEEALLVVLEHVPDLGNLLLAVRDGLELPGQECLPRTGMNLQFKVVRLTACTTVLRQQLTLGISSSGV